LKNSGFSLVLQFNMVFDRNQFLNKINREPGDNPGQFPLL